jgi:tRNA nucleotidyltransferase/poly(A) polymerase
MSLLRDMKNSVRELSAERVFKELKKALQSKNPHRFFEVLRDCDCLSIWFPEIANLIGVPAGPDTGKHKGEVDTFDHTMRVVKGIDNDPVLRFSGLCHDLGKALSESPPNHRLHDKEGVQIVEEFCLRLKVPKIYKKSAKLFCKQHIRMHRIEEMNAGKACRLITDIVNGMHLGVSGFLVCSVGDFMTAQQANRISIRADKMLQVRLPKKHIGRGSICSDILLQERCKVWKSNGDNIS